MKSFFHYLSFLGIRLLTKFIPLFPYTFRYKVAHLLTSIFLLFPSRSKRLTFSNIARAARSTKWSFAQQTQIVHDTFTNLLITTLDYFILADQKNSVPEFVDFATDLDRHRYVSLLQSTKGVLLVSSHQSNWEVPFLLVSFHAIAAHKETVAIGRPIANTYLYDWILKIRTRYGGKIVSPKNAVEQCNATLEKNGVVGIVADQAYPSSTYGNELFGTAAWSSSTPAFLAKRHGIPMVPIFTHRHGPSYKMQVGEVIDFEKEDLSVAEAMDRYYAQLEQSIKNKPGEWLWQHNRWKQPQKLPIRRKYRYDFLVICLPDLKGLEEVEWLDPFLRLYHNSEILFCSHVPGVDERARQIRIEHGPVRNKSLEWSSCPIPEKGSLPERLIAGKQLLLYLTTSEQGALKKAKELVTEELAPGISIEGWGWSREAIPSLVKKWTGL